MRTINFRDGVLFPVAFKIGLDPSRKLLRDQAEALAAYINEWVRRGYDQIDHPEWTLINEFTPDTNHIVAYDSIPVDLTTSGALKIWRVFKVYLSDPRASSVPVDTYFRQLSFGVHCGFDHGTSVWIKFNPAPPEFTTNPWDGSVMYAKEALVYSLNSGECYKSKGSRNIGHEPFDKLDVALSIDLTQVYVPPVSPVDEQDQIYDVYMSTISNNFPGPPTPISDPPPPLLITIIVHTAVAGDVTVSHTSDGIESLSAVMTDLKNQLAANLNLITYTITADVANNRIRLQDASNFSVDTAYNAGHGVFGTLQGVQVQSYIAPIAAATSVPQINVLTLSSSQVLPGATYQLNFLDSTTNLSHQAQYVALPNDPASQIILGLINAMQALAAAGDTFFQGITSAIDATGTILTLTRNGPMSVDGEYIAVVDPFWEYVPFPLELADQVIRGAYSDAKREAGQTAQAMAEEQAVPQEAGTRAAARSYTPYNPLTDQSNPKGRYSL